MSSQSVKSSGTLSVLILAGGRGQRMGGVDKGLQPLNGQPLIQHVIDRLGALPIRINANRNSDDYRAFGCPVLADQLSDYQGPLAGMAVGLRACPSDWLLIVPCDSPRLPLDLAERLHSALANRAERIAVAHDGQRLQPVVALLHRDLYPSLETYLAGGDRKIDLWFAQQGMVEVDFSDQPDAFINLNTLQEKEALENAPS